MTTSPIPDLNETIVSAVNARVEAQVLEALSGDATIGRLVAAALQRPVEVPDPKSTYGKVKVPFLSHVIEQAVRDAAKQAVERLLIEEAQAIEDEVRKVLRKGIPAIAAALAGSLQEAAKKPYGVKVELDMPRWDG